MALKIFKFERNDRPEWGEYHAFVVVAESEAHARELAVRDLKHSQDRTPWENPDIWNIEEIGLAHPHQKEGEVVSDFYEP